MFVGNPNLTALHLEVNGASHSVQGIVETANAAYTLANSIANGSVFAAGAGYASSALTDGNGNVISSTYVNKGGDSVNGKLILYGSAYTDISNAPFGGAIEVREAGLVYNSQTSPEYAPRIGFHWGNVCASALAMHSDACFYRQQQNGNAYKIIDTACFNLSGTTLTITT